MTARQSEPIISVILPVYNCPNYIRDAVESVLCQTFDNFELILIDDGSTDDTPQILRQFTDVRIRLITQQNQGLAAALNQGIRLSRGRYIARQDHDDLALPERFSRQIAFLESNPHCALVGTWAKIWRSNLRTNRMHQHPADNATLHYELMFNNPFVHSSVMIRKSALERVGVYSTDATRQPPEDYELWSRVAREYEVANIPEMLQIYREVVNSISRSGPTPFVEHLVKISAENIAWATGTSVDEPAVINLAALMHSLWTNVQGMPDFKKMHEILNLVTQRFISVDQHAYYNKITSRRIHGYWMNYWEFCRPNSWRGCLFRGKRQVKKFIRRFYKGRLRLFYLQ